MIAEAEQYVDSEGRRLAFGEPVSAIVWIGDTAWFALGDGRLIAETGEQRSNVFQLHNGAILSATAHPGGQGVLTGGDDGRLLLTSEQGQLTELGAFGAHWIENIAVSRASGVIAASVGREVVVWLRGSDSASHRFTYPSSVMGLALDRKGRRLAAAHYCGVTLNYALSPGSSPKPYFWAGSHLGCTFSENSDFLISSLQETGLHGWILPGGEDMQMSGYRAKTRSFSWSRSGKWLATSGDTAAILWPFQGKRGPMGCAPVLMGPGHDLVTRVSFHPFDDVLAVGHVDGTVVIVRMGEQGYVPVSEPGSAAISALEWNNRGNCLGWGSEDGCGGIVDVEQRA